MERVEKLDKTQVLKFDPLVIPVVHLEWVDHASTAAWSNIEEVRNTTGRIHCYTTAYLIKDTPEEISVTTTISDDGNAVDPLTIDRRLVISMEVLPRRRKRSKLQPVVREGDT